TLAGMLLLSVGAARPASGAKAQTSCTATLTFQTFNVVTDTDENPPYVHPDRWTVHVYAYVNGVLGTANPRKNGAFRADSGTVVSVPRGTMLDNAVVGTEGDPVDLLIKQGPVASRVKEADPSDGTQGV